jgi:predicted CopG family antitoxin
MSADKRIRVSEERREQLHEMKDVGESYDEVLAQLIQEHNRKELAERMREVDEMDADELVPLDE